MIETKDKIIETASRLFADQGYAATSLRQIIADAGVNLAAVHYHFGSKEELLDALVHLKAEPVNRERMSRLDRLEEQAAGSPLTVEEILRAFLEPTALVADQSPVFVRVMGRIHAEGLMPGIVQKHFQPTAQRFLVALRKAVPDLPEQEFLWRVHFMMGAMSHTMCGAPSFGAAHDDFHVRMARLVRFLSAGFRAPAPDEKEDK
jgi:AcrR family transcriptional regulator